MTFTLNPAVLALATVEDAHNQGARVRVFGEEQAVRAHYDAVLQSSGVVVRTCHLVVVDRSRDPWEIIWRIGTRGIIRAIDDQAITLDLGYRVITIPLHDGRPENETAVPLTVGTEVLLQGKLEQAIVSDVFIDGELAHPERLRAHVDEVIEQKR